MSRASKFTLVGTSLMTAGIVYFVHWTQEADKAAMHAGVQRDLENQRIKRERQADFEMQRALEAEYRKIQTVSDNRNGERIDGTSGMGVSQSTS
ncbi:cytochrome c oxidase assembly protein [Histoplasma ohiense]|nr:cytochrome c oxidase assembly protein [Histoplasma ohiense (nom. inval.)]